MTAPHLPLPVARTKLAVSLLLGAVCAGIFFANPSARDVQSMEHAWQQLWQTQKAASSSDLATAANEDTPFTDPMPSISAGAKYYAVSQDAKGEQDLDFDKKVTSFIETSQARAELLVATLESEPSRAKTCTNTTSTSVCERLHSIMTDAVTSLDQAELAVQGYQRKGVVADPVLARLQAQGEELKKVSLRYPGIGPKVER